MSESIPEVSTIIQIPELPPRNSEPGNGEGHIKRLGGVRGKLAAIAIVASDLLTRKKEFSDEVIEPLVESEK